MELKEIIQRWFATWESGDYLQIPITENFRHSSPFGIIDGKKAYLDLVKSNIDKFLGHRFEFHDELIEDQKACIRYTATHENRSYRVSEWFYKEGDLLKEVVADFNVGAIGDDKKLKTPQS